MKRFIFILALICTVFFATGLTVSADYSSLSDDEVISYISNLSSDCGYDNVILFRYSDSTVYCLSSKKELTLNIVDGVVQRVDDALLFSSADTSDDGIANGNLIDVSGYTDFWGRLKTSRLFYSNYTVKDTSGNLVFPLPPVPDPTPEPEVPTTLEEAIQTGVKDLVMWIVTIVATIFLGGTLLVIWRPLFRMSRRLLQMLFRQ